MRKSVVLVLAALCITLVSANASAAQNPATDGLFKTAASDEGQTAADGDPVQIDVAVIHATKSNAGVDSSLENLAKYLVRSFRNYSSFALLSSHRDIVSEGHPIANTLPNGAKLTYEVRGREGSFLLVGIDVDGLTSTVKVKDGGMFFQAGRAHDGGMIILAFQLKTPTAATP